MKRYRFKLILGLLFLTPFLANYAWIISGSKMNSNNISSFTAPVIKETQTPAVDPEAVELLRRALDFLSNLTQFNAQFQSTFEDMHESGHRVDLEISGNLIVNRPNKLRVERFDKLIHQIFYFDGKALTLYNPSDKVYATEPVHGTIEEMFHFTRDTFGLSYPVTDLLYRNSFSLLIQDVNFAVIIGKEMIGEVQCDHLLFSRPGVDFQIWIADNDTPLPFKYIVTDTATPELLSFTTVMRNWNIAPDISDTMFDFVPPNGTKKIIFIKVNPSSGYED